MIKFNNRQIWLDALRTLLALGVVANHCHLLEGGGTVSYGECFYVVIVPCFYFLAGFLAVEGYGSYDFQYLKSRTVRLFRQLVVPAVFFMFVYLPVDEFLLALSEGCLRGNYFLLALFEMNLFNIALLWLCNKSGFGHHTAVLALSGLVSVAVISLFHDSWYSYFQWKEAVYGNAFFVAGMIAGRRKDFFIGLISKSTFAVAIVALFAGLCIMAEYGGLNRALNSAVWKLGVPFAGSIAAFSVFYKLCGGLAEGTRAGGLLRYFGERTLAAYILFWVLMPLLDLLNAAVLLPLGLGAAVYLADVVIGYALCMALHDALCSIPHFERLIFGRRKPLASLRGILFPKPGLQVR